MKRLASNYLKTWINHQNRKPLVIRGARQVGKTELVRRFCQDNALDLIEINLEEKQISEFKKESNFDLSRAINEILALTEKKLTAKSLIFLDEIQECTLAYERLRFFKEQRPDILSS
jgi:predicted AAA+ superfamily ATPase